MNFKDYQKAAARTMDWTLPEEEIEQLCFLGLYGETGEVADLVKKELFHGHPRDAVKMEKELGDCLWYFANLMKLWNEEIDFDRALPEDEAMRPLGQVALSLCDSAGDLSEGLVVGVSNFHWMMMHFCRHYKLTLSGIAEANEKKLRARYPLGFDKERSRNRTDHEPVAGA